MKESKELIAGLMVLSIFLIERLKDGVDLNDAIAVYDKINSDEEFKAKVFEAVKGISGVKEEIHNASAVEISELVVEAAKYIPEIVKALS
jgi:hypothetical protein